jgi:hypothetical protein
VLQLPQLVLLLWLVVPLVLLLLVVLLLDAAACPQAWQPSSAQATPLVPTRVPQLVVPARQVGGA